MPFLLSDGKADVTVMGPFDLGLDVDDMGDVWANLPPAIFQLLETAGVTVDGSELRFKESFLLPGDRIQVVGRASVQVDAAGTRDSPRAAPLRRTLSGIDDRPVVVADVDEDDSA